MENNVLRLRGGETVTISNDTDFWILLTSILGDDVGRYYKDRISEIDDHIDVIRQFRPDPENPKYPRLSEARWYDHVANLPHDALVTIAEEALQIRGFDE